MSIYGTLCELEDKYHRYWISSAVGDYIFEQLLNDYNEWLKDYEEYLEKLRDEGYIPLARAV